MIPAILSCVFVLYLYRTLNAPDVESASGNEPASDRDSLVSRIDELSDRIERLTKSAAEGREQ